MKFLKVLSNVILSTILVFTAQTVQANKLADIKETSVLKVAVPQDFPPFGSVGLDFKPVGYDIDMAKYLAKKLNVTLELVPVTSEKRIYYLQTGKVDLVISSMGKNPAREKVVDFSDAYAPFFLGVFGTKDEIVTSTEELANKTVGVTRGSIEDLELSRLVPGSTIIKRFEDNNSTLSAFLSGQVSLIATGNIVVAEIATRYPDKAPKTKFLLHDSPCYVGIMKGETELMAEVNRLIKVAKQNEVLENLSQKWLKAPFPAGL